MDYDHASPGEMYNHFKIFEQSRHEINACLNHRLATIECKLSRDNKSNVVAQPHQVAHSLILADHWWHLSVELVDVSQPQIMHYSVFFISHLLRIYQKHHICLRINQRFTIK